MHSTSLNGVGHALERQCCICISSVFVTVYELQYLVHVYIYVYIYVSVKQPILGLTTVEDKPNIYMHIILSVS